MAARHASRARTGYNNQRRLGANARLKLLQVKDDVKRYKLLHEFTNCRGWFIGRAREGPGGPLIDKLLLDESATITLALVRTVSAIELVTQNGATRYALDNGFIAPIGTERRFIATLRVNHADKTPIDNV